MSMNLPENVGYGKVVGRFLLAVADGPDADRFPDGKPAVGKVTFTPAPSRLLNVTASPPVTIIPKPIECALDDAGYLVDPEDARGVWLIATDDNDNNPVGWPYQVQVALEGVTRWTFHMEVPEDTTIDLTTVLPVAAGTGKSITRGEDGVGVPGGGTAGDVLAKAGGGDHDTAWRHPSTFVDDAVAQALADDATPAQAAAVAVSDALADVDAVTRSDADNHYSSARLAQILADTRAEDSRVALHRVDATEYFLWQSLGAGRWWRTRYLRSDAFVNTVIPGGYEAHQLHMSHISYVMVGVNETANEVIQAGDWVADTEANVFGGTYVRASPAGASMTFTTPPGTTAVGLHGVQVVNGGVSLVTIDGDPTLANALPTAQQLVTSGALDASALTTGGGTLTPDSRVMDQYAPTTSWGARYLLAEDLPADIYEVAVEVTGYKQASAANSRAYISGFAYTTLATVPGTPGVSAFDALTVVPIDAAWEYAHNVKPAGANTFVFLGTFHGYEDQTSLTFEVDGAVGDLSDGQVVSGRQVVIRRESTLRHPDTGATDVAIISLDYTVTGNGIRIAHRTTWLVDGLCVASYPAMWPVNKSTFARGMIDTLPTDLAPTQGDGKFLGAVEGHIVGAWEPFGEVAAVLYIPDTEETVDGWVNSGADDDNSKAANLAIEDRPATSFGVQVAKFYVTRVSNQIGGGVPYSAGDRWNSEALYRVARVARGADAAMSSLT